MRDQGTRLSLPRIEQERQMVRFQAGVGRADQHAEGVVPDNAMKLFDPWLGELLGEVHGTILASVPGEVARAGSTLCLRTGSRKIASS